MTDDADDLVFDDSGTDAARLIRLYSAVIAQALNDACTAMPCSTCTASDRDEARNWFRNAGKDFQEVCALAGLEWDAVQLRALAKIEQVEATGISMGKSSRWHPLNYTVNGETMTLGEWTKRLGLSDNTLYSTAKKLGGHDAAIKHYLTHGVRTTRKRKAQAQEVD